MLTSGKTSWDCYQGQEKNWPIDDWRVPSNDLRNSCGAHFSASSLLLSVNTALSVQENLLKYGHQCAKKSWP